MNYRHLNERARDGYKALLGEEETQIMMNECPGGSIVHREHVFISDEDSLECNRRLLDAFMKSESKGLRVLIDR